MMEEDVFSFIDRMSKEHEDLIDLSIGNPDGMPHPLLLEKLKSEIDCQGNHGYGCFNKNTIQELRQALSHYYKRKFHVELDKRTEVAEVSGTKTAIYHILSLLINKGDKVLIPSPSYSVYATCVNLLGGEVTHFPSDPINFQPEYEKLNEDQLRDAKVMILCSPGNPTSAILMKEKLKLAVTIARKYDIKIIHDLAYVELNYSEDTISSIFSVSTDKTNLLELYSLSKSCNVPGWRLGFVSGCPVIISKLKKLQFDIEFGVFIPFQKVGISALQNMSTIANCEKERYKERIDYFVDEMKKCGWMIEKPKASFFIWTKVPKQFQHITDKEFVLLIVKECGVLFSPGSGFGLGGEGFIRIALVQPISKIKRATKCLQQFFSCDGEASLH
ncbi:pyridoxal phosphate-dependent aminotransferase [Listeria sp. PSOL-1]|uniref:pyridoxal phosphate-dependent aminotransferase n=1 Tax=Listeria sp. PSOL-1 TaxID=1844999 RepID=UPI0013D68516|nr:pyridoxal phosphate-dependent aminotransferase [Listeria sp. PSOL-1]